MAKPTVRGHGRRSRDERLLVSAFNVDSLFNPEGTLPFLQQISDVNARHPTNGFTALHIAAYSGLYDCALDLIRRGADVNARTETGVTPLYSAVLDFQPDVVSLLLDYGADTSVENAAALGLALRASPALKKIFERDLETGIGQLGHGRDSEQMWTSQAAAEALVHGGHFAIFVGAGVSIDQPSCLPAWPIFRNSILGYIRERLPGDVTASPISPSMYEIKPESILASLHEATGTVGITSLLRALEGGAPNANHVAIASLAKRGIVRVIVTTNFDTLIEQALEHAGYSSELLTDHTGQLLIGRDDIFYVVASDEEWQCPQLYKTVGMPNGPVLVLKLHGTMGDSPRGIAATLRQTEGPLPHSKRHVLEAILSAQTLLVSGYSGYDNDFFPFLLSRAQSARSIFWGLHPGSSLRSEPRCEALCKHGGEPVKVFAGNLVGDHQDPGHLFGALARSAHIDPGWPQPGHTSIEWQVQVAEWVAARTTSEICEMWGGFAEHVGSVDESGSAYERAIASGSARPQSKLADLSMKVGRVCMPELGTFGLGDKEKAYRHFIKALDLAESDAINFRARVLWLLAAVLRKAGYHSEEGEVLARARELVESTTDVQLHADWYAAQGLREAETGWGSDKGNPFPALRRAIQYSTLASDPVMKAKVCRKLANALLEWHEMKNIKEEQVIVRVKPHTAAPPIEARYEVRRLLATSCRICHDIGDWGGLAETLQILSGVGSEGPGDQGGLFLPQEYADVYRRLGGYPLGRQFKSNTILDLSADAVKELKRLVKGSRIPILSKVLMEVGRQSPQRTQVR